MKGVASLSFMSRTYLFQVMKCYDERRDLDHLTLLLVQSTIWQFGLLKLKLRTV